MVLWGRQECMRQAQHHSQTDSLPTVGVPCLQPQPRPPTSCGHLATSGGLVLGARCRPVATLGAGYRAGRILHTCRPARLPRGDHVCCALAFPAAILAPRHLCPRLCTYREPPEAAPAPVCEPTDACGVGAASGVGAPAQPAKLRLRVCPAAHSTSSEVCCMLMAKDCLCGQSSAHHGMCVARGALTCGVLRGRGVLQLLLSTGVVRSQRCLHADRRLLLVCPALEAGLRATCISITHAKAAVGLWPGNTGPAARCRRQPPPPARSSVAGLMVDNRCG
jgi:hypothetical protein